MRNWIFWGCIHGFFAVALGAFAAHGLKNSLDAYSVGVFETGVRYHFYHALALLLLGVYQLQTQLESKAGYFFHFGILIFSGSLYALALTGIKKLGMITPIGGVAFLIAWVIFARQALLSARSKQN